MNNEKVYLKGYVVGHSAYTLGYKGLQIQLENMDIVEVDKNLVYKNVGEPQKVMIPQFVADLIEEARDYEWDLDDLFEHISDYSGDSEVSIWFYMPGNIDLLARAWLDGYEIDKEKRYIVKLKGADEGYNYLNHRISSERWFFSGESEPLDFSVKHTRKELEQANFGWVFDCPGVEIEEVL